MLWDLSAAHLAAAGSNADLALLLPYVRGFPDLDAIDRSGTAAYAPHARQDPNWRHVADLLRALGDGDLESLAFITIGSSEASLHLADLDGVGTVRLQSGRTWRWPVPISGTPLERRFRLAGGVGTCGPSPMADLERLLAALPLSVDLPRSTAVIVVLTEPGWHLLSEVAKAAAIRFRSATLVVHSTDGQMIDFLEGVIRQLPLRATYEVVFMDPQVDGSVELTHRPIFEAGSAPTPRHDIDVYAPVGAVGPVTLPVVVRNGEPTYASWKPVALPRLHLPRGQNSRLRARLDASAEIELTSCDTDNPRDTNDPREWRQLLAAVPRRLHAAPMDIVFLVERVRDGEQLALARSVLEALAFETWHRDLLRVGIVQYGQHRNAPFDRPVAVTPFISAQELGDLEIQLIAEDNINDYAAALEDAIAAGAALDWRAEVSRLLVTIGSRPPYPAMQTADRAGSCRYHLDWRAQLAKLDAVERIAVWRDPDLTVSSVDSTIISRSNAAWSALGHDALLDASDITVERLMTTLGIAYVGTSSPFAYAGVNRLT